MPPVYHEERSSVGLRLESADKGESGATALPRDTGSRRLRVAREHERLGRLT